MTAATPSAADHRSPSIDAGLRSLLPYLLGLVLACLALQATIAVTGGGIGALAGGLLVVIALGAVVHLARYGRALGRLRFGLLTAHGLLFVSVNGSFALHALLRRSLVGDLDASWWGPIVAMPAFWSLGLLLHALGSLLDRGFEGTRP